jgi:outer membrane protein insertion porin family
MCNELSLEGMPDLPFARVGLFFSPSIPPQSSRARVALLFSFTLFVFTLFVFTLFVFIFTAILPPHLYAQTREQVITGESFTGSVAKYEIDEIRFSGNIAFPSELLAAVIASRPSEQTLGRNFVRYLSRELDRNPATPKNLQQALKRLEKSDIETARYFDKLAAAADTTTLAAYYRRNGFHRVRVEYDFLPNPQTRFNTLLFRIQENAPTPLDTIVYYGLESVAPELADTLGHAKTLQKGTRFSQTDITTQNDRILTTLRDNGYYSARYKKPILSFLADENRDSVTVVFEIGFRKRFGAIAYVDSSASYSYLSPSVPQSFVEIKEGDWFSEAAIVRSVNNLYNFGLFDLALIVIDTSSRTTPHTDSSLAMKVLTRTRRVQGTDVGVFVGQIPGTSFLEAGGSFRYENKNLFGKAQALNLQTQLTVVDINTFFNNILAGNVINARLEWLVSGRFSYPLFTNILGRRVDLNAQLSYSLQSLAFLSLRAPLLLETGKLYLSFPVLLPSNGVFTSFFADINLDRQRPINFDTTRAEALALAKTPAERQIVLQQLFQYELLDSLYKRPSTPFLTSTILTLGMRGDHRDNLFNPHKGYFLDASLDGAGLLGASEFLRVTGEARWYESFSKQSTIAARIRVGYTYLFNPATTFIPLDRQFFAGGSNSVRAWNVRELRYRTTEQSNLITELNFVGQFVGSGSVLEGSVEWRYNFAEQASEYGSFFERQFSRLGMTCFVDWGNAFNSYLEPPANIALADVVQNLALAAGVGIRYDTSVGPFRVDFAWRVFDPASKQWLFERTSLLPNIQIGLGYAF